MNDNEYSRAETQLWNEWNNAAKAFVSASEVANEARRAGRKEEASELFAAASKLADYSTAAFDRLNAYRARHAEHGLHAVDGALLLSERAERAGCLDLHRSPITGHVVGLYRAVDAALDTAGGPYATVCEKHHTICNHQTLRLARRHLDGAEWCEACVDEQALRTGLVQPGTYAELVRE